MQTGVGERFAQAIAARDTSALLDLLKSDVDFRALTPGRFWEADSAREVVDEVIFGHWFEPQDRIDAVEQIETGTVGDRHRVGYRFRVTNPSGEFTVEQQAYLDVENDRITWLRIMCSGFRLVGPVPAD
jgi:hypothetical protein